MSVSEKNPAYQDWYEMPQEELRDYASGGMGGFSETTDRLNLSPDMFRWEFQELPVSELLRIKSEADWRDWYESEKRARRNEDGDDNYFDGLEMEWGTEPSPIGPIVLVRVGKTLDIGDGWHRSAIAVTKKWKTVPAVVGTLKKENTMTRKVNAAPRRPREDTPETAGIQYATAQLESDHFTDWVRSQIIEAARMPPEEVLPLDTVQDARVIAKNMLQQLEWDTKRELDAREIERLSGGDAKGFFEGFHRGVTNPSTVEWLAEEILDIAGKDPRQGVLPGVGEARRSGTAQRGPTQKHMYVWQISLQVTSPDRPALRHQIQYRVQARSNEKGVAIQQAKDLAARDGHTVVDVVGATKGYRIAAEARSVHASGPTPAEDPEYVVQGLYKGGVISDSFGYDDEDTARSEAWKLFKSPYFEGDYVRIITRDGELVWDSRGNSKGKRSRVESTRGRVHASRIPTGSAVMVINPDSMYRSERGTVVELDARRSAKLDNFNRERVRKGAVLVERSNGSLFVVDSRDLAFYKNAPAHESRRVRDYAAIDSRDRVIAGPFKHYSDAKDKAGPGGHVKFIPKGGARPAAREPVKHRR